MKPLENFAAFLSLPVSVLGKASEAEIAIGRGASVHATGDLSVDAEAQALANGNAIYWFSSGPANKGGVAVVYDETNATANVTIASGASLSPMGTQRLSLRCDVESRGDCKNDAKHRPVGLTEERRSGCARGYALCRAATGQSTPRQTQVRLILR